ncbi:helix-turn-helix transcriptional regulator [Streptomyces prasinus]|uniref:helix-turn-helix domain-containing protein n=1 Tax=Streptomyces prasinus TaxID=67345 RepID=UPI003318C6B0
MGLHTPTDQAWRQLGTHISQTRATQGVTQEFLAHWIGVDRSTLQRIERGAPSMKVAHLSAIEAALALRPGASLELLAGGTVLHVPRQPRCDGPRPLAYVDLSEAPTLCGHTPRCTGW